MNKEDEFYNVLKGFTKDDIPYLAENRYLFQYNESSSYTYYTVIKPFTMDTVKLEVNNNVRHHHIKNIWHYNGKK